MDADEAARTARLRTAKAEARVTWLLPEKTSFSQTDKFSTPPEIRRPEHKKARYPDQWHLTAETAEKAQQHTFVTVIQPCHAGEYGKLQPPGCTLAGDCTIG
ncbi:MAG: hypothetical protein N3D11_11190, partial [Candidatus Sumerlaeia bacterium]|nr:hypothetical protein [Candidatus Sumerlaeia bacterium]